VENIFAIGVIRRRQGRWQETLTNSKKAIALNPRDHFAIASLGRTYNFVRQFPQAERYLDRARFLWRRIIQMSTAVKSIFTNTGTATREEHDR